jgi:hypothetical protein
MTQTDRWMCGLVAVASLLVSCSSDNGSTYVRPKGRGSAACQAWQKAFCDFAALDCKAVSEAQCVDTYYTITCNSDEKAQSCATAIDNASCSSDPITGCNIDDLADPAPAVAACNSLLDAICKKESTDCGQGTIEQCMTTLQAQLDCSKAIGYAASYETCLSDLAKMACNAPSMPGSCTDVIRTTT